MSLIYLEKHHVSKILPTGSYQEKLHLDGEDNTLSVIENLSTQNKLFLKNGHIMGEWHYTKAVLSDTTPTLSVILSWAQNENFKKTLVLGIGKGLLPELLLKLPAVEEVTTVESDPNILSVVKKFSIYQNTFKDPRSHLATQNYRAYLDNNRHAAYDTIFLSPVYLTEKYISKYYTQEFYKNIYYHLSENGMYVQSIFLKQTSHEILTTLIKTLQSVFPHTKTYFANDRELIILSKKTPFSTLSEKTLFQNKDISKALRNIDITSMDDLKIRSFLDDDSGLPLYVDAYTNGVDNLLFDHFPYLERDAFIHSIASLEPEQPYFKWSAFPSITKALGDNEFYPSQPITQSNFYLITRKYEIADEILSYFIHPEKSSTFPKGLTDTISQLTKKPKQCSSAAYRQSWLNLYLFVMQSSVPFLKPQKMHSIMASLKYPCQGEKLNDDLSKKTLGWVALYEAYINRDYQKVLQASIDLMNIEKDTPNTAIAMGYFSLAQIRLHILNYLMQHYTQPTLHMLEVYNKKIMQN